MKNYLGIWRHLNKFLINLDHNTADLSWEEKTALFGAYLVDGGVQSSTLKSYFSAIKHVLKVDGYPWNDSKVLLSALIRGCKLENDRVKLRLPIQKNLLEMLLFEIERFYGEGNSQPYLELMYKALFSLAYYGMLRVGELTLGPHTIRASDIHVGGNKEKIMLVLYSSKTHGKESGPQKVKISAVPVAGRSRITRFFCPFALVTRYLHVKKHYGSNQTALFTFSDGSTVKPEQVRTLLRALLHRINLDASLYDVHSFRIGRACDLYKFGYSLDRIKSMGRWKSNAVYRYLKN